MSTLRVAAIAITLACLAGCVYPPMCVVEGSDVATPLGPVPIEEMEVGDPILSIAPDGTAVSGRVVAVHASTARSFLEIDADGHAAPLRVTPEHPVAVPSPQRWRRAGDLRPGDPIMTVSGPATVSAIRARRDAVPVHDLTVTPHPAYMVADVIVHNKSIAVPPERHQILGSWVSMSNVTAVLTLEADGTSVLALMFVSGLIEVYRCDAWTLDGSSLSGSFHDVSPRRDRARVFSGSASEHHVSLKLDDDWPYLMFARESAIHDRLRQLEAAIEAVE